MWKREELGTSWPSRMVFDNKNMEPAKNGVKNNPQDKIDGGRKNKFLYRASSTQKADPWSRNQNDDDEFGDIIKPDLTTNGKERTNNSPGVDLDNVWSIRKNVLVTTAIKNGTALKTNSKSYYSRHGGLSASVDTNTSVMAKKQRTEGEETGQGGSGWSVPRPGYSYSDKLSFSDTGSSQNRSKFAREFGDIIADENYRGNEDFESKKNRLNNIRLPMPGAPQIASREMSARTKRAHNLHQAHLKSSGLGQYSSSSVPYSKQLDDSDNNNLTWRSSNDLN